MGFYNGLCNVWHPCHCGGELSTDHSMYDGGKVGLSSPASPSASSTPPVSIIISSFTNTTSPYVAASSSTSTCPAPNHF